MKKIIENLLIANIVKYIETGIAADIPAALYDLKCDEFIDTVDDIKRYKNSSTFQIILDNKYYAINFISKTGPIIVNREYSYISDFIEFTDNANYQRVTSRQLSQLKKDKLVITTRVFNDVQLSWGKKNDHIDGDYRTNLPFDSVLHYAGGTLALKRIRLPEQQGGCWFAAY